MNAIGIAARPSSAHFGNPPGGSDYRLFTVADIVLDDIALGFGDDPAILRRGITLLFIVVIVPDQECIIVGYPQAGERACFRLARPGVYDLDHLIKADGPGTAVVKQPRSTPCTPPKVIP